MSKNIRSGPSTAPVRVRRAAVKMSCRGALHPRETARIVRASGLAVAGAATRAAGQGPSLCENVREQRMRRIVFSLFLFRLRLPVLFFSYSTQSRQTFHAQVRRWSFHTGWVKVGSVPACTARPLYPRYCCKSRKSNNPENLAKVDLWTSLLLRCFSALLRRSVIDFG